MQVGWLVDAVAFDSYHNELVAAIERNGHRAISVTRPNPPYQWDDVNCSYRNAFPTGACVVVHADLDLVRRVQTDQLWIPGALATVPHYFCSYYYPRLGPYLLNKTYLMLPFGDVPRQKDWLFETLGHKQTLFIRPDSPLKLFTGQTISWSEFDKDYEFIGFNGFPLETMVVISGPQVLLSEWRFVIANGRVVTGSQYKGNGQLVALPAVDIGAAAFAERVVGTGYNPDPVWVLDVGLVADGTYHIVETGGFSFAGLYACDKDLIVQAVSAVAENIYQINQVNALNRTL